MTRTYPFNSSLPVGARAAAVAAAGLLAIGLLAGQVEPVGDGPPAGLPAQDNAGRTGSSSLTPPQAVPAYRQANTIAVLSVHGEIDHLTLRSLERRIAAAKASGAEAIVLDIDTPGGRLDATLDICNLLKKPSETPPNLVAWINPQAYSAGTIISLACREIIVAPNATFGDAAPIHGMPLVGLIEMAPTERAKVEAPLLAEIVDSARRNHYDENLVQSFVSVGIELWLIEHVETGERIIVDRAEYATVFDEAPDEQITSVTPAAPATPRARVAPRYQGFIQRAPPSDADAMSPEEIKEQIEYQQQLPPSRDKLTAADRGQWRAVTQIISDDRLLTVKPDEAIYYGLATSVVADDVDLKKFFGASTILRYERSWSETLVRFLVSFPVRVVLIIIFIVALFIELAAPGVGVFGTTAMIAVAVLIGAPYLAGMAQWWDIVLIVAGLVLLALEILVIPGTGLPGALGALAVLIGLVGTFVSGDLGSPAGQGELGTGLLATFTALVGAGIGVWAVSRNMSTFPILGRLALRAEVGQQPARPTGRGRDGDLLRAMSATQTAIAVGDLGTAETDLRPAGRGSIGGRLVDVQATGRYIERGSAIRVITVDRYVIEVEEAI